MPSHGPPARTVPAVRSPRPPRSPATALRALGVLLRSPRHVGVALAGVVAWVVLVGVPTAVVPTPWFGREVPVQWWNPPVLGLGALLGGLLLATYVRTGPVPAPESARPRWGVAGGVLSAFAVGCPVCNKLVMALLGASGAMSFWAPLQPAVAIVSLALPAYALYRRLTALSACPVPRRVA